MMLNLKEIVVYFPVFLIPFLNFRAFCYTNETDFVEIESPMKDVPKVIEFFSFHCPQCFIFNSIYQIPYILNEYLPENISMRYYHVSFLGPLGYELTRAWSMALVLGVEKKVSPLLFKKIHTHSINSYLDIRSVFFESGVSSKEYDEVKESYHVLYLTEIQQQFEEDLLFRDIPAILIQGKYIIDHEKIQFHDLNSCIFNYSSIINYLLMQ